MELHMALLRYWSHIQFHGFTKRESFSSYYTTAMWHQIMIMLVWYEKMFSARIISIIVQNTNKNSSTKRRVLFKCNTFTMFVNKTHDLPTHIAIEFQIGLDVYVMHTHVTCMLSWQFIYAVLVHILLLIFLQKVYVLWAMVCVHYSVVWLATRRRHGALKTIAWLQWVYLQ